MVLDFVLHTYKQKRGYFTEMPVNRFYVLYKL